MAAATGGEAAPVPMPLPPLMQRLDKLPQSPRPLCRCGFPANDVRSAEGRPYFCCGHPRKCGFSAWADAPVIESPAVATGIVGRLLVRTKRPQPQRFRTLCPRIQRCYDPQKLRISFNFDREWIELIKGHVPGRAWNPASKSWTFPVQSLPQLAALMRENGVVIDAASEALLPPLPPPPPPAMVTVRAFHPELVALRVDNTPAVTTAEAASDAERALRRALLQLPPRAAQHQVWFGGLAWWAVALPALQHALNLLSNDPCVTAVERQGQVDLLAALAQVKDGLAAVAPPTPAVVPILQRQTSAVCGAGAAARAAAARAATTVPQPAASAATGARAAASVVTALRTAAGGGRAVTHSGERTVAAKKAAAAAATAATMPSAAVASGAVAATAMVATMANEDTDCDGGAIESITARSIMDVLSEKLARAEQSGAVVEVLDDDTEEEKNSGSGAPDGGVMTTTPEASSPARCGTALAAVALTTSATAAAAEVVTVTQSPPPPPPQRRRKRQSAEPPEAAIIEVIDIEPGGEEEQQVENKKKNRSGA